MKKTLSFIVASILITQICNGQDTTKRNEFYNKEFKWKILVPEGFDTMSAEQYEALQKQGVKDLEKTINGKIDGVAKRICAYKSKNSIFNYFEANQQFFDMKTNGDFFAQCKGDDDEVYDTFKRQLFNNTKIDTTISNETIDGLVFRKFKLQISFDNERALNMYIYSMLFDNKEFTVVIEYLNKTKGDLILNAWRNSKFEKE
jgi:type IV secretory pathway VirD2 relaxase